MVLAFLVSCQSSVEPEDQGRFGEVPEPPPTVITFDPISNIAGPEGGAAVTPALNCNSTDGTSPDFFSVIDDNAGVDCRVITGNIILCEIGTFTGHSNQTVTLNAYCNYPEDGKSQTFTLTVIDVNQAPVLNSTSNQTIYVENPITTIDFSDGGDERDADNDPITYSCTFTGGAYGSATNCSSLPGVVNFNSSLGTLSWTPNITAANGTSTVDYSFTVIGSDDQSPALFDTQNFTITVKSVVAPTYVSTNPASPNNSSTTPLVIGTSSADTANINLYTTSSCSAVSIIGTGNKADWDSTGVTASVSANATTPIYAQAVDGSGNKSICVFMTNYTHDNIGPTDPTFISITPTSPSNSSTTPSIIGGSSTDTVTVNMFSDAGCSTQIGTDTKAGFEGSGVTVSVSANTVTSIYARALDSLGNPSNCVPMTNYEHDNIAPSAPGFVSTSPSSPSSSVISPNVIGSASTDTVTINLFSDVTCSTSIGSGTRSTFIGSGIVASASPNATTSIYAESVDSAGNASACTLLTSYTHDNTPPSDPVFSSTTPVSPSSSVVSPNVIGTSSVDTQTVTIYSDNICGVSVGSDTKATFEGAGISTTLSPNSTTNLYAKAFDSLGNASNCVFFTNYTHDNTPPNDPAFVSTTPNSPNNSSTTPSVIGTASADTVTVNLFSENTCTTGIGSGTKANFESGGISVTASANASTTIYGEAVDSLGNTSNCVLLVNYIHDNTPPTDPVFSSSSPSSPSNIDTTPQIIGTSSADTVTLNLHNNASCSSQIGTGTKALFEGAGIEATVSAESTTAIYAQALDSLGNTSSCVLMINYTHDSAGPSDPTFSSTSPSSPSTTNTTPNLIGSSSADTVNVSLYSDSLCTTLLSTGTKASFEGAGIGITVSANSSTTIYAQAEDALTNKSGCVLMTTYTHDNTPPTAPTFVSTSPASPSTTTTTPAVIGGASADTVTINLYNENTCTTQIGSGARATFVGSGISASATSNATTTIYGESIDAAGNTSACTLLTSYVHDNTPPTNPSFSSTSPASPSTSDTAPEIIGTSSADTTTITLYSDNICTVQIGTGTKAAFEGVGITATVTANSATSIYAKAFDTYGNTSSCTLLTSYTHDNSPPADPTFVSTTPASPNNSSTTPSVIGSSSSDTVTIDLFSENTCSTGIGSGTKANFESGGVTATVSANATTTIYAEALDSLGNTSNCVLLTSYTHDNISPTDPTFSSTSPASPSNSDTSPEVIGSSSADTVTLDIYSNASCTTQIGTGTKAQFEGVGISTTVASDATTSLYAKAYDNVGNASSCTLLTNYVHDSSGPNDPSFSSTNPSSPSNSDLTPNIIGLSSSDTTNVSLYSDSLCAVLLATNTKAVFEGIGIEITVSANTSTTIYAEAEDALTNKSNCVLLTSYVHDNTPPANPGFVSTSPASPSTTNTGPSVIGSSSSDTVSINLYNENTCTTGIGSGTKANFEGAGISASVTPNATTTIYGESLDDAGNTSACTLLTSYIHDNTAPTNPTFSSTSPASPSSSDTTPEVIGSSSADTTTVTLYSDNTCTTQIGTGTKATFEGAGLTATVSANTTTSIYAKAFDTYGNGSSCTLLTSYTHDNTAPTNPSFVSTTPSSPSNSSTTPSVVGTASADTVTINLYSENTCSTGIGSGTKANFESGGISATVTANATTTIYAEALDSLANTSSCVLLTSYTHDNTAPTDPTFSSTSPASPSSSDTSPEVIGSSSADTVTVNLYSNASCTIQIGTGTKATFEGTGITATVSSDATTSIYAKAFDSLNNGSSCTLLTSYTHDATGPIAPSFVSTNPSSPSNSDTTPNIIGSSSADTVSIELFSDNTCSTSLGSDTKANFEGTGIGITVTANTSTTIYARSSDSLSNTSACTLLTTYTHDNTSPSNPAFSSTSPASPNNSSTTPSVIGTASADTVTVNLYNENTCTTAIGSGTRAQFVGSGITASATPNFTTTIYAEALDQAGNTSSCVLLVSYEHDNTPPSVPSFSSSSPASPSNSDTAPEIIGSSSIDTVTINLHSNSSCTTQIGTGTKATFEGVGITASVSSNSTTTIYAEALDSIGNTSNCTLLTNYTHDNIGPTNPAFSSISPSSPNNSSTTPTLIGTSSADTSSVEAYSDSGCTTSIGSGTKVQFEGGGISITGAANTTTTIYLIARDSLSNDSACTFMTNYTHDNVAPSDVTAVTDGTNSTSISSSPTISWSAATDATTSIDYYEVSIGTTPGATDTKTWTNVGNTTSTTITSISPNLNSGTTYYANVRAIDTAGNTGAVLSGDGWLVDATPPSSVTVTANGCTTKTFKGSWTASSDSESSIDYYEYSIGTSAGADDEITWTNVGTNTSISLTGQSLLEATTYYLNVRATNTLGLTSSVTNASTSCSDLNTSLQGFWLLGEAAGARVDEQGANDLTANGSVSQQVGIVGNSTGFNSATSDYLSVLDGGELTVGNEDFSISVWVYISDNTVTQPIITKWNGSTNEYYLEYIGSTGFRFTVDSANVSFPIGITNNTWYHVIAYHDSSSDVIGLEINAGTPNTTSYTTGPTSGDSVFEVGAQSIDGNYFTGRIDSLGFWKKILTEYERDVLYNAGSGLEPAF